MLSAFCFPVCLFPVSVVLFLFSFFITGQTQRDGECKLQMKVQYSKIPVTSLASVKDLLLSGAGGEVTVHQINNFKLLEIVSVFKKDVVHGIKIFQFDDEVFGIAFGGRSWCDFSVKDLKVEFGDSFQQRDWILDAQIVCNDTNEVDRALFITAHNIIEIVDWSSKTTIKTINCEEKCILYSASFLQTKQSKPMLSSIVVCCGTVFNEIILWKIEDEPNEDNETMKVVERIKAHDGVIFHMSFHLQSGFLLSASDDRSIRLWKCKSLVDVSSTTCLATLYGHGSRVWKAEILQRGDEVDIVSIGEDGSFILWKIDVETMKVNIMKKMSLHRGRNIWSMACDQERTCVFTGGADGGIKAIQLDNSMKLQTLSKPIDFYQDDESSPKFVYLTKHHKRIVVVTSNGTLLTCSLHGHVWNIIHRNETNEFGSCTAAAYHKTSNTVAMGSQSGAVVLMQLSTNLDVVISKLHNVFESKEKIHKITIHNAKQSLYILLSGFNGDMLMLKVCDNLIVSIQSSFTLPQAKHRWHMDAVMIDNLVVCGDRRGSILLYKKDVPVPVYTLHAIHGKHGVTSVKCHDGVIVTTGRDGLWRRLNIDTENEKLQVLSQSRADAGMDWLTTSYYFHDRLLIAGFHGNEFVLWHAWSKVNMLSVTCGGGHREWDFGNIDEMSTFVYLKGQDVCMCTTDYNATIDRSVVKESSHGRQITTSVAMGTVTMDNDHHGMLFATGSEDTKVDINLYITSLNKVVCLQTLDDHISSIRSLNVCKTLTDPDGQLILFTAGGRSSLNCYRINKYANKTLYKSVTVQLLATYGKQRIMSKFKGSDVFDDIRHMDLCSWCHDSDCYFLASACSDGHVRVFQLDTKIGRLTLFATSPEHDHCYISIINVQLNGEDYVMAGSTAGVVHVWKLDLSNGNVEESIALNEPLHTIQCHQSGVNGLTFYKLARFHESNFMLGTSGDDNSIFVQLFDSSFKLIARKRICDAHSTQITGLKFIEEKDSVSIGIGLLSASIDQRVTKWTIDFNATKMDITFNDGVHTFVADISSLNLCDQNNLLICGQGLNIIKLF